MAFGLFLLVAAVQALTPESFAFFVVLLIFSIGAGILAGIGIGVGTMLLVVPGLYIVGLISLLIGLAGILLAHQLADSVVVKIGTRTLTSTITAPVGALVVSVVYFRLLEIKAQEPGAARSGLSAGVAPLPPGPAARRAG